MKPSAMRNPIGRDFKRVRPPRSARDFVPAGLALLVCAFALTSLRTQVLKLRYELADHLEHEQALRVAQRDLTVHLRRLRAPRELAVRAHELGFGRPERLIDLPGVGADATASADADAPADAAEPLASAEEASDDSLPGNLLP